MTLGRIQGNAILNDNGDPTSGAVIRFYEVGTLTPKAIFSDISLSVSLGYFVVTDASGRFTLPYTTNPYKIRVETSLTDSTLIFEQDHIGQDIAEVDAQTEGLLTIANVQNSVGTFAVTGGSSNAYTLTLSQALSSYQTGQFVKFKANHTNTGASTINVSNVGVVSLKNNLGTDLVAGDIVNSGVYSALYDGTGWKLTNSQGTNQSTIQVNTINELTTDAGVTVDGVLIKDNTVTGATGTFSGAVQGANVTATTAIIANTIKERTAGANITLDKSDFDGVADFIINAKNGYDARHRLSQGGAFKGEFMYDDSENAVTINRFADVGGAYLARFSIYEDRFFFDNLPVEIEGICKVNTINELTSNAGVTLDGVLIKDGALTLPTSGFFGGLGNVSLVVDTDNNSTDNGFIVSNHNTNASNRLALITDEGNMTVYSRNGNAMLTLIDASEATIAGAIPSLVFGQASTPDGSVTTLGEIGYTNGGNPHLYITNNNAGGRIITVSSNNIENIIGSGANFNIQASSLTRIFEVDEVGNLEIAGTIRNMSGGAVPSVAANNYYLSTTTRGLVEDSGNVILQQLVNENYLAINSAGSMVLNIDANNDQTNRSFQIRTNSDAYGGNPLLVINESAVMTLYGNLACNNNDIHLGGGSISFDGYNTDKLDYDDVTNKFEFFADGSTANSDVVCGKLTLSGNDYDIEDGTYTANVVNGSNGNATIETRHIQKYYKTGNRVSVTVFFKIPEMAGTDENNSYLTIPYNFAHTQYGGRWTRFSLSTYATVASLESALLAGTANPTSFGQFMGINATNQALFRNSNNALVSFGDIENGWLIATIDYIST